LIDEYGGIEGLVTLDDILEAIVGDIPTADELLAPPIVRREDGSWLIDGLLPVDEFKALFDIEALPEEDGYQTLGGFVVTQIGRIPMVSDHFEWDKLRFEVVDMDGNRIDKVLIASTEPRSPYSSDDT
jgi:putative hemolysin